VILEDLAERHGRRSDHGVIEIGVRLTQPELATMCGAAEISVQKMLGDMNRTRVARSRHGRIVIWDPAALRCVARGG
jgi:hypothetical protein